MLNQVKQFFLVVVLSGTICNSAFAGIIIQCVEVGADVVCTGSGFADLSALTLNTQSTQTPVLAANGAYVIGGTSPFEVDLYISLAGPQDFADVTVFANGATGTSTGDAMGDGGNLHLPRGYISGSPLNGSSTFFNHDFNSLGITGKSTTRTWGAGGPGEFLTISAVPEPSSLICFGLVVVAVGFNRSKKRRQTG